MRSINKSENVEDFSIQIIILYFRVKKYMKLSVVRLEICIYGFVIPERFYRVSSEPRTSWIPAKNMRE
ncbi:MAG: hypothetical protein B6D34_04785 [Candidatus Brocadia sp. UTAMX1]|nr:MAG: hypothetical protein B6D34_04785 [Candidatus Brocadia sp. UTAMX1]